MKLLHLPSRHHTPSSNHTLLCVRGKIFLCAEPQLERSLGVGRNCTEFFRGQKFSTLTALLRHDINRYFPVLNSKNSLILFSFLPCTQMFEWRDGAGTSPKYGSIKMAKPDSSFSSSPPQVPLVRFPPHLKELVFFSLPPLSHHLSSLQTCTYSGFQILPTWLPEQGSRGRQILLGGQTWWRGGRGSFFTVGGRSRLYKFSP